MTQKGHSPVCGGGYTCLLRIPLIYHYWTKLKRAAVVYNYDSQICTCNLFEFYSGLIFRWTLFSNTWALYKYRSVFLTGLSPFFVFFEENKRRIIINEEQTVLPISLRLHWKLKWMDEKNVSKMAYAYCMLNHLYAFIVFAFDIVLALDLKFKAL